MSGLINWLKFGPQMTAVTLRIRQKKSKNEGLGELLTAVFDVFNRTQVVHLVFSAMTKPLWSDHKTQF